MLTRLEEGQDCVTSMARKKHLSFLKLTQGGAKEIGNFSCPIFLFSCYDGYIEKNRILIFVETMKFQEAALQREITQYGKFCGLLPFIDLYYFYNLSKKTNIIKDSCNLRCFMLLS